jgi:hypothetical protein
MPRAHECLAKATSSILLLRADDCFSSFHTAWKARTHWHAGAYIRRLDAPRGQWIPAFAGKTKGGVSSARRNARVASQSIGYVVAIERLPPDRGAASTSTVVPTHGALSQE